ncbi:hypothetical protein AYO20_04863 [Fonsecaea nubica]|uniref:Uncharacterized protein n=1 Tax=Fonsecaea nubica TaxID=856822 RepID=A0A178D2R3_9EURO|nr:hypothetical protein AYO20_04863 [Fonsecaea nubica]OAL35957.1 hypothetical protein AYO20_04863 [Fonsecaea nubica]
MSKYDVILLEGLVVSFPNLSALNRLWQGYENLIPSFISVSPQSSVNHMDYLILDAEVIQRCRQATPDNVLSHPASDNKVLGRNEFLVAKFGFLLSEDEARNQMKAYEILDPGIVHVPRVYRYFKDYNRHGYIVMDYMKGERKEAITTPAQIRDMFRIL